jgi:hypothetical protein
VTPKSKDDEAVEGGYLAQHGEKLLENGYHIVPIRVGGKAPGFDGWEKSRPTKAQLKEWLEHGHKWAGVGILTKNTPAIDIDIRDEKVALLMDAWVRENLDGKLVRIGQAPKRLFVFRTDKPFRKMRTTMRTDEWGDKQQIEVLGEGQQFVAFHKHPDTKKPYVWPDEGANPLEVQVSELPTVDESKLDELLAYFEEVADQEGWAIAKGARLRSKSIDEDNPYVEDTAPVTMSDDEIRARLLLVPNPEDHDTWFQVGMALYHQWDGEQPGLQFWHEWSETADNYDADAVDRRWETFKIDGKKRAPVTVRFILKLSSEAVASTTAELGLKLRDSFINAKDMLAWEKARKATREAEIDGLTRSSLAQVAKERRDAITGTKTSLVEVKKAIAYSPASGEKTPGWTKPWVYDTSDDRFYSTAAKISTTQQGFCAMYDRQAMTKKDVLDGKSSPSSTAAALALNFYKIQTVNGRRYEPGRDAVFYEADGVFANTYPEHEIPEMPEKALPRDKRNVERIKKHIAHLLADPEEQRMFTDWLAWVVQNPGQHVNYAIMLQGVEGDGKSFFAEMMRAVMGVSNVRMLNAHIFESPFTDWMVGQCLACVEEVRIVKAQNKFEVINRIKPAITNKIIEIHPKGKPVYNAKNTTSYMLYSNYRDALPLDDDGRRFLVLFSQWQRKAQLQVFKTANPSYYSDLYAGIEQSPGAIRQWLLDHEPHEDFNPMGDAPVTKARAFMIRQAKHEFIQELDDIIRENEHLCASAELVNVTAMAEVFMSRGVDVPANKTMHSMLMRDGYEELGRFRIDKGERALLWTKRPELFQSLIGGEIRVDVDRIKKFIKKRKTEIDSL